jgi:hypothetical protein
MNKINPWFTTEASFGLMEQRIVEYYENHHDVPQGVFLSLDMYAEMLKTMAQNTLSSTYSPTSGVHNGQQLAGFYSSVGFVNIYKALNHVNLMYVGHKEGLERIIWDEVDRVFEEEVWK